MERAPLDTGLTRNANDADDLEAPEPLFTPGPTERSSKPAAQRLNATDAFDEGTKYPNISGPTDDLAFDFLRLAQQVPLLDEASELSLARQVEVGVLAAERLGALDNDALRSQDARLLRRLQRDGAKAQGVLVRANLRLVVHIARRMGRDKLPLADRIQEGNIGLIRAVQGFDFQRGFRFTTYATWWIRQSIARGIANSSRVVRLPVHVHDDILRVEKAERLIPLRTGLAASASIVAQDLEISEERVIELRAIREAPLSLEELTEASEARANGVAGSQRLRRTRDESALADDSTQANLEAKSSRRELARAIEGLFASLSEREVRVLQLRFGFEDDVVYTLERIGDDMGLTRERIRQIESKTLEKIRHPSRRNGLLDYRV